MSRETEKLVSITNELVRAATSSSIDEAELCTVVDNVICQNEKELRAAENWSIANNCWIDLFDVFNLGEPGPSGSESDTYIGVDGYVYKQNNLLHNGGSIVETLTRYILHNCIFEDTAYSFVGFTGFHNRSVFPVVRQKYILGGVPATRNEIDCYMSAIGFTKQGVGQYMKDNLLLSDVLPKNVFKDPTGDIFVIDAEIRSTNL